MPVQEIELEVIHNNPYQKRHHYNDIPDLARTIAVDGLQQIPKGRWNADGVHLKFGHRRTQAFRWLKENWKKEGLPERYSGYTVMPVDTEELTDEQMFRGATIENNQRADLSPIERMEEMKAWVAFGYTSKQIAEMYPGMSDSTVRGLLYFDQLKPEAKEALHEGRITQGVARAVLSLQKAAKPSVIAEVLKEIHEEESVDVHHWGGRRLPDEIVKDKLEEQPNVKSLWMDSRGGKPRATHDGWLLDMKNFPNKFLPPTTVEHALLVNPDKSNVAFVGSLELFKSAQEGLAEADVYVKFIEHLENPPACSACPFYTKMDGEHYCGMNVCFSRKERAWSRQKMHDAGKKLGITLYDRDRDGDLLIFEDKWRNEKHAQLFNKKGADLRLAFMEDVDRKRSQNGYEGIEDGFVVGVVGETLKKLLKEKVAKREAEKEMPDVDEIFAEMMKEKAQALMLEASIYIKSLFESFKDPAMKALDLAPAYGWHVDEDILPEPKERASQKEWADYSRRMIAYAMLDRCDDIPDIYDVKNLAEYAGKIADAAKGWGVKMPAAFTKLAAGFDAEIKAVVAETKKAGKQ